MRIRPSWPRLLAILLAGLWAAACVLLLGWYRPGGPLDLAVGVAAIAPAAIAAASVGWPPPSGRRGSPGAAWLGLLSALVLTPLVAGVAATAAGHHPQSIVPSPEVAYAWLITLGGTSLFAALGIVGRTVPMEPGRSGPGVERGPAAEPGPWAEPDPRRVVATAGLVAVVLAAASAGLMGGAALANAAAARDQPAASSRFGPTDPGLAPPGCSGEPAVGATATLSARLAGEADRASLGEATIEGSRSGQDIAWTAAVATSVATGPAGVVVIGSDARQREPGTGWMAVPAAALAAEHLDATVLAAVLVPERLLAAEDRGLVQVEGAPARHCRVAIDGNLFRAAFPQVRWFAADHSLHRWRGEVDYYVFGDGQLGLVEAWVNGEAEPVSADAIQATIRASLSATNRGEAVTLELPAGG